MDAPDKMPEQFCLLIAAARAGKLPNPVTVRVLGADVSNVNPNEVVCSMAEHYEGYDDPLRIGVLCAMKRIMKACGWGHE